MVAELGAQRPVDYLMRPKRVACKADPERLRRLPMFSNPQPAPRKLAQPYGFRGNHEDLAKCGVRSFFSGAQRRRRKERLRDCASDQHTFRAKKTGGEGTSKKMWRLFSFSPYLLRCAPMMSQDRGDNRFADEGVDSTISRTHSQLIQDSQWFPPSLLQRAKCKAFERALQSLGSSGVLRGTMGVL